MISQSFTLRPFPGEAPRFPLEIAGAIGRRAPILSLRYELRGDLAALALPDPADRPARRDGLWQETCFEIFLAPRSSPQYWEFNLSPAGHWNVYAFEAYRQGMHEESTLTALPFSVLRTSASLLVTLEVDMSGFISSAQPLDAAISAVIKSQGGSLTYWALTHPGPQPDFHRRDTFIIEL
jgi:hypothetical protein